MLRVGSVFVFSLEELVKPEKNGLIFRDSEELAQQLQVRRIVNKITDFFLEKIYFLIFFFFSVSTLRVSCYRRTTGFVQEEPPLQQGATLGRQLGSECSASYCCSQITLTPCLPRSHNSKFYKHQKSKQT